MKWKSTGDDEYIKTVCVSVFLVPGVYTQLTLTRMSVSYTVSLP